MNNSLPPFSDDERLAQLAEGQLHGTLSADEKAELANMLDSSEAAQRRFIELVSFESALTEIHKNSSRELMAPRLQRTSRTNFTWKVLPWLAAAACLVLLVWPRVQEERAAHTHKAVAMLVNQVGATFATHGTSHDAQFDGGQYELSTGTIHLRLSNGADLVIESPAKFELTDAWHARLEYGIVRAMIPPAAIGFTIATANAQYEDVGTEFGLHIDRSGTKESLLVFDGQVNVRRPDSNELVRSVVSGEAVQFNHGRMSEQNEVQAQAIPTPGSIGIRQWRAQLETRLKDASLIAFFSFQQDASQPMMLQNVQANGASVVSSGWIHGAKWGSGRWQGKDALIFDDQDQFAELIVEGEFQTLTVATWIKVNRLDHALNAVFDSNGWENGDIHLQIHRQGAPYSDLYQGKGAKRSYYDVTVPTNEWTYLTATYSLLDKKTKVYVNSKLAYESSFHLEGKLRPDTCRIGNWLPVGVDAPGVPLIRSFNGSIDELAIWNRILSETEIKSEMQRGQPDFVWARQQHIP